PAYDIEITQSAGRPRPGGWTAEVILRHLAIAMVVADVCRAFELHPTRSRGPKSHGLSGCAIAAAALDRESVAVSEPAVVKGWTRYRRAQGRLGLLPKPNQIIGLLAILRHTLAKKQEFLTSVKNRRK